MGAGHAKGQGIPEPRCCGEQGRGPSGGRGRLSPAVGVHDALGVAGGACGPGAVSVMSPPRPQGWMAGGPAGLDGRRARPDLHAAVEKNPHPASTICAGPFSIQEHAEAGRPAQGGEGVKGGSCTPPHLRCSTGRRGCSRPALATGRRPGAPPAHQAAPRSRGRACPRARPVACAA
jgi:hypothetical protein